MALGVAAKHLGMCEVARDGFFPRESALLKRDGNKCIGAGQETGLTNPAPVVDNNSKSVAAMIEVRLTGVRTLSGRL